MTKVLWRASQLSYPILSLAHVLQSHVSGRREVCYFAREIFAQQNVSGSQITMNYLNTTEMKKIKHTHKKNNKKKTDSLMGVKFVDVSLWR